MFLWGRFWFRRVTYGWKRMPSLVPELVKKWCKPISAEQSRSVKVSYNLMNAYKPATLGHVFAGFNVAGSFAAVAA